jgi:putative membrane protein
VSDPRVFFAAERTLLAWLRSGLTLMALGFVVARFGLFLTLLAPGAVEHLMQHRWLSDLLGVALVLTGAAIILCAQYNHHRYVQSLPPEDVPKLPVPWLTTVLTCAISCAGVALAVDLMLF